jgi:solute carrier family 25 phosphate transporter 3
LAASASAEFVADVLLCPFEAMKVRIQTSSGVPSTLRSAAPLIYGTEGLSGFYKGLSPLWMRQIPYTCIKFLVFERTVETLYKHVVPKPRDQCTKAEQLTVTFVAGYIAGVFCAVVSHPADTVVSKLNKNANATISGILKELGPMGKLFFLLFNPFLLGVWKGLLARIVMIGTLTGLQWFAYDSFKVALNLPRPPPPVMPDSLKKKLEASTN